MDGRGNVADSASTVAIRVISLAIGASRAVAMVLNQPPRHCYSESLDHSSVQCWRQLCICNGNGLTGFEWLPSPRFLNEFNDSRWRIRSMTATLTADGITHTQGERSLCCIMRSKQHPKRRTITRAGMTIVLVK